MSSISAGVGSARTLVSIERLLSRNALIVGAALAAAALLAWLWLLMSGTAMDGQDMVGMANMAPDPWSASYLLPAFVMWALMMVAMMLPSAAPMILLHARIDRADSPRMRLWHTLVFGLMYLAVWAGFSVLAAAGQALLIAVGLLSAASLALGDRALVAALLAGAALYQLSSAKAACLDQCRSPIGFVMRYWRPGTAGAVRLGLVHGLYCLGCCWMLMLLLFVGGVMNLAWVAALAAIVFIEKLAPPGWHASRVLAAALALGAAALIITG